MTNMIYSKETVVAPGTDTVEWHRSGLWWAIVILTILVAALGTWIIYDFSQGAATAPSAEMSQLVDDYTVAWNDYDSEDFMALTTADYTFHGSGGVFDQVEQAAELETTYPRLEWQVGYLGESIVVGDGPWYVSMPVHTTTNNGSADGIAIMTVVDVDGVLLVRSHEAIGDF